MPADQEQTAAGSRTARESGSLAKEGAGPLTFRSPFAVLIWWLWVLFALGNLIDLAVQGRDHFSVVAAFILVLVTGVVYTTAQRPRIIADDDGLSIINPVRQHRVGWAAVTAVEATDLLRVRCEWPLGGGQDAAGRGRKVVYSWAMHSSRRRQVVSGDVGPVVAALGTRAEIARAVAPGRRPRPPESAWSWPALAAIAIPALALAVAIAA